MVGWEKTPGKDTKIPIPPSGPGRRSGLPILIDMKPAAGGKWEGQIYNAKDGKMYRPM